MRVEMHDAGSGMRTVPAFFRLTRRSDGEEES